MRLFAALLVGLSPTDPLTFGAVAKLMVVVTVGAGYVGARKALSDDPVAVLKYQ